MKSSNKRVASEKSVQQKETPNLGGAIEEGVPKKERKEGANEKRKQEKVREYQASSMLSTEPAPHRAPSHDPEIMN